MPYKRKEDKAAQMRRYRRRKKDQLRKMEQWYKLFTALARREISEEEYLRKVREVWPEFPQR